MINMTKLIIYVITVLLVTANSCFSKPTISNNTTYDKDTEWLGTSKLNKYENIQTLSPNSAINSISSEEYEYRSKYATQMLSSMNRSINPCDDFYEYACGNWKNIINERMIISKRNNILDIVYKLVDTVAFILQRPHINNVAPEYAQEFELAKKFYNNCLQAKLYPMQGSAEYLAVLKEIGGFPAVETNWNSNNFNWINMSAHLSNYGIKSFVSEHIDSSYPFPPYFKLPDFGFDIELHNETIGNSSSNAYVENTKRMREILTIYGVKENRIDGIITDILHLLKEILKLTKDFNEDDMECELLKHLIDDPEVKLLEEKWHVYNKIAWLGKSFANYSEEYEECCMPCHYLYGKMDQIIEKNKEAAANYLALKFLFHTDARLNDVKFQNDFCIFNVKSSMKFFFDHLHMKLHFDNEVREEISEMINEIRTSLRFILQNANWLDDATREAALLKESTIREHIGRYENETMTKLLIGAMKNLKFVNGNYEANNLNLRKFKQYMKRFNGLNFQKLDNNTKPLELLIGMQANSFYYNIDNSIYVMAGILMEPVYNKAWPNSLKFGTLGYLIGHEFTHGFDTVGANYNEAGEEKYWWSSKSGKVFSERSECYVDHYQSYLIPEIKRNVNGILTKDENIADGGGIREALMAYRRYIKNMRKEFDSVTALYKEEQMPGIDLTPEQLFFLGFAQLWCASYEEADYWEELANEHVIDKYRVLGVLSNNVDFAKAYNCPVGSKMNPSQTKCEIW